MICRNLGYTPIAIEVVQNEEKWKQMCLQFEKMYIYIYIYG